MALHGKNGFEVVKINIRALPIISRRWRPWMDGLMRPVSDSGLVNPSIQKAVTKLIQNKISWLYSRGGLGMLYARLWLQFEGDQWHTLKYVTGLGKAHWSCRKFAPKRINKAKNSHHRGKNHTKDNHHYKASNKNRWGCTFVRHFDSGSWK